MNLRLFSIALLLTIQPIIASAGSTRSLGKKDFVSAQESTKDGKTIVSAKLSELGKSKFKKLNETAIDKEVHSEIAGVLSDFKLREPIKGDSLEMGPYSAEEARKVVTEINKK